MPNQREMFCAKSFDRYLSHDIVGPLPCWESVPQGEDPPDFFLKLGPETLAVEVTSTQVWRQPDVRDAPVREETFEDTHHDIALAAEKLGLERGLSGRYVLSFDQPVASHNFARIKSKVVLAVADAIARSQALAPPWSEDIIFGNSTLCWLFKGSEGPMKVHIFTGDTAWTESPEFLALVTEMLRRAISEKKRKLEAKDIKQPLVLLLLNTYMLAEPSHYLRGLQSVDERRAFHSIFLVHGDGTGTMLQSENRSWAPGKSRPDAA